MSKLQELIDRLCPNGVEYKPLGEVCEILDSQRKPVSKGKRVTGEYPYYGANGIQDYVNEFLFDGIFLLVGEDGSVINMDNSPILNWAEGKIWVNNHAHILKEINGIKLRYLYYALQVTDVSDIVRGTPPKLNQANLRNILIPIPPLEVQEEIVRILDRFADYAAELQAELQARKEQYKYYRNLLLTFNPSACGYGTDDEQKISETTWGGISYKIQWKKLGEICYSLNTGLNPRQFFKLNTPDAEGYYVTIREIRNGRISFSDKTDRINDIGLRLCNNRSNLEIGDVLFSGTGTIGQVAVVTETPTNWNIKEGVYAIKPNQKIIKSYFLRYILESKDIKDAIMKKVAGGTVQSIPMAELKNIIIPVPPLELQEKIAAILERFETLVNDISKGLPAEIEAVKARYEYYRNKLLTFKPLPA